MHFPPLIERELRVALRQKRPVRARLITASVCVGGALLFLGIAWLAPFAGMGRRLHQLFCLVGAFIVLQAPPVAAGAFAVERGDQTLGLLFLSGLSAAEVFVSKAFSAALVAWNGILALSPMLALPFFLGGVSFDLFVATVLALPTLLVFVLAVTLLASVLSEDEGAAVVLAATLGVAICAVPPAIYLAQTHFASAPPSTWWLRLSPAYAAWLIWDGRAPRTEIASNLGVSLVWSSLFLGTAAARLKRLWREQEEGVDHSRWRERWRGLVHGEAVRRRAIATEWLDLNPFVWLAACDRQPTFLAGTVVGGITAVWLLGWVIWRSRWPSVPNIFLTIMLLNSTVAWVTLHTAARNLARPRRDGTFELLLTTRLQPSDIVWGGMEALRRQFRNVGLVVVGLDLAFLVGGLATRRWNPGSLFVYGVVAGLLLWWGWRLACSWRFTLSAAWAGLNSARPAMAAWRVTGLGTWGILYNFYLLRHAFAKLPTFPSGSTFEVICAGVALVAGAIVVPVHFYRARRGQTVADKMECRLVSELREIAREPVPDRDHPGFKRWNPRERFPWGWEHVQAQLHERLARK